MSHTKEPWSVAEESFDNDGIQESVIRVLDGRAVIAVTLDFGPNNPGMREANARRIVVCVNACAGIPTESLEGEIGVIESVTKFASKQLEEVRQQRDELLAALEVLLRDYKVIYDIGDLEIQPALHQAHAAIAKVKEGAK